MAAPINPHRPLNRRLDDQEVDDIVSDLCFTRHTPGKIKAVALKNKVSVNSVMRLNVKTIKALKETQGWSHSGFVWPV